MTESSTQKTMAADPKLKCIHELFDDLYEGQPIDIFLGKHSKENRCRHNGNNALHLLFARCTAPHHLLKLTKKFVQDGVDINGKGEQNNTPFFYLLLNVNRGLKFDTSQFVETILGPRSKAHLSERDGEALDSKVCEIDQTYQDEVYATMDFLLKHGADVNIRPEHVPVIHKDVIWDRYITDLLLLNRSCWYFLQDAGDEYFKSYCEFDTLKLKRIPNTSNYTLFHIAAWRGRSDILSLMLPYVDDPNAVSDMGMNALHFLYCHFVFPKDSRKCTSILLDAKVDVNQRDKDGLTPLFYLLRHVFVKKCFYHCMATAHCYTSNYNSHLDTNNDALECINLLIFAGADLCVDNAGPTGSTVLTYFFLLFSETVITQRNPQGDLDAALGRNEFPWTPFTVNLGFVIRIVKMLLENGSKNIINAVDSPGKTPLEFYLRTWRYDRLLRDGNTAEDMVQCMNILLDAGADPNCVITDGLSTPVAKVVCGIFEFIKHNHPAEKFIPALDALFEHGANPHPVLQTHGTILHLLFTNIAKHVQDFEYSSTGDETVHRESVRGLHKLLKYLYRRGMSPDAVNMSGQYPIQMIPVWRPVLKYGPIFETTIQLMERTSVAKISNELDRMNPDNVLPFYQTLFRENSSLFTMFSLQHLCRLAIYSNMRVVFYTNCRHLPIPKTLQSYLWDLVN